MKGKVSIRHLLAGLAAFVLVQAAFLLDGQGLAAVFGRYAQQIDEMAYEGAGLADHAAGVYSLMTVASVREFSGMGMYLGFASCAAGRLCADPRAPRMLDADTLLLAALLLAAGLPLILPQMNARSLYLAGMLAFACANSARRLAIAVVLELISLCSYMEAIFYVHGHPDERAQPDGDCLRGGHWLLELLDKLGIKGALRPVKATLDALDERLHGLLTRPCGRAARIVCAALTAVWLCAGDGDAYPRAGASHGDGGGGVRAAGGDARLCNADCEGT